MFTDNCANCLNIFPEWKTSRSWSVNESQTIPLKIQDKWSQYPETSEAQVQAEAKDNAGANYDSEALKAFLDHYFPVVSKKLESNLLSHAFDQYVLLGDASTSVSEKLYQFISPQKRNSNCVAWNCSGSILAVGYGQGKHEKWCGHDSAVCLWNLSRPKLDVERPYITLETDGCVAALSFHPLLPTVIALSKVDGELLVIDCSSEDGSRTSSLGCKGGHDEMVTGLHWVPGASAHSFQLVSCGLDGRVSVWNWLDHGSLQVSQEYLLLAEDMPNTLGIRSHRAGSRVGATCFAFNKQDDSLFVVATEGGALFQCSRLSQTHSPLGMSFERHLGHITGVEFCPNDRNLLASVSSYGELRIHSLLQVSAVLSVCCNTRPSCIRWHPSRSGVLAVSSLDGITAVYDLRYLSKPADVLQMEMPVFDLQFGPNSPHLLAAGGAGCAHLWTLPSHEETVDEDNWFQATKA